MKNLSSWEQLKAKQKWIWWKWWWRIWWAVNDEDVEDVEEDKDDEDEEDEYDDIEVKIKTTEILKYIGGVKKNLRRDLVIIGQSVYTTDDNEEDVRNEKSLNVLNCLKGWMEKMKTEEVHQIL